MLIRLGYEIAIECPHQMPVISLLEIDPARQADIKRQSKVLTSPHVESSVYTDSFGNSCRRFMAPEGGFPVAGSRNGISASAYQPAPSG